MVCPPHDPAAAVKLLPTPNTQGVGVGIDLCGVGSVDHAERRTSALRQLAMNSSE